jgi:cytochrome c5
MFKVRPLIFFLFFSIATLPVIGFSAPPTHFEARFSSLKFGGSTALEFPSIVRSDLFKNIWKVWEPELLIKAKVLPELERQKMIYDRYGLVTNNINPQMPLGFVIKSNGNLGMNCLVCHAGNLNGTPYMGLPNSRIDLRSLIEDIAKMHPLLKIPTLMTRNIFPQTRGLINPIGEVALALSFRDQAMNLTAMPRSFPYSKDSVVNAMPWWNVSKKSRYFSDAFFPSRRIFLSISSAIWATGIEFRSQEAELESIFTDINSLEAPKYPMPVNEEKVTRGLQVFRNNCARCHGSHEDNPNFPDRIIPWDVVRTDPVRALDPELEKFRRAIFQTWLGKENANLYRIAPGGYLAVPLNGVWATAPYFHNGSVPTLYDVIFTETRPKIWMETNHSVDFEKVGLSYAPLKMMPKNLRYKFQLRRIYNTEQRGFSNSGHYFSSELNLEERFDLLEYLKTL